MDTYERRCRRLLRAYPIRWRERRGDELIGTLLDLAEPGQRYPSLGGSFDVVRAGLLTRWRERPPLGRWLLYRVFAVRLPAKWRMWARDDIRGWGMLGYNLLGGLAVGLAAIPSGFEPWVSVLIVAGYALAVYAARKGTRRRALRRQGFRPDGGEQG